MGIRRSSMSTTSTKALPACAATVPNSSRDRAVRGNLQALLPAWPERNHHRTGPSGSLKHLNGAAGANATVVNTRGCEGLRLCLGHRCRPPGAAAVNRRRGVVAGRPRPPAAGLVPASCMIGGNPWGRRAKCCHQSRPIEEHPDPPTPPPPTPHPPPPHHPTPPTPPQHPHPQPPPQPPPPPHPHTPKVMLVRIAEKKTPARLSTVLQALSGALGREDS